MLFLSFVCVSAVKLVSKDGKEFLIEKKFAFVSNLIKTSLENGANKRSDRGEGEWIGRAGQCEQCSPSRPFMFPFLTAAASTFGCAPVRVSDPTATEVPMPGVKADILAQVVKFMEHHRGVEPAIPEKPLRSKVRNNYKRTEQQQMAHSDRVDVHSDGERRRAML